LCQGKPIESLKQKVTESTLLKDYSSYHEQIDSQGENIHRKWETL
jgi:hypothetical protein